MSFRDSFEARCCETPLNILDKKAIENDNNFRAKNIISEANHNTDISVQLSMAMTISISALEKRIPKEVKHWTDDKLDYYFCPSCEYEDGLKQGQQYCDVCGQALEW